MLVRPSARGYNRNIMRTMVLVCLVTVLAAGCAPPPAEVDFGQLEKDFVYSTLALSPVTATGAGYHQHQGVVLDELLDDYSPAGLERKRRLYRDFEQRLGGLDAGRLSAEEKADLAILNDQIGLGLLDLDTIQAYRHNPTVYVELIGTALFNCYVLDYAPRPERFRHIVARLEKVPALLEQARANLADAPEVWNRVARQELEGNVRLIDKTLREAVPAALREDYERAAGEALAALAGFDEFLKNDLAKRRGDWRLGRENYAKKFRYVIATDAGPDQVLDEAEKEFEQVRRQMYQIAVQLHQKMYPRATDRSDPDTVIRQVLDKIAERRPTPETYVAEARRDLKEATDFVARRGLVPLLTGNNLQVIPTPEFMRGIYSVGGFNPAPPLEPELGAFYWITPIPPDWPKERIASKLREYNFYGLKLLTIHEAMPGHYVQFEYANRVEPESRRLVRALFGNGPYIEGWAVYATEMMLDEGYLDHSPELRLTFLKQQLRVMANAILDVRLQTTGMSDAEAMSLMTDRAFQEPEEASGKLVRAKLSSCQLPTYFVGWRDWHRLRRLYRSVEGDRFQLARFHETMLKEGAVPVPVLARLVTGVPLK